MNTQELMAYSVAGLFVVSVIGVLALLILAAGIGRRLGAFLNQSETFLRSMQEELTATLQEAHITLERVERLAKSTDTLVKDELIPAVNATRGTLQNVERTTGAVRATVEGLGRIAGIVTAYTAISKAERIAEDGGKAVKSNSGKIGLLALGLKVGLDALLQSERKKAAAAQAATDSGAQTNSRRESNGTAG